MKEKEGIIKKFLITTMMTIKITVCYYALKLIKYVGVPNYPLPPGEVVLDPERFFKNCGSRKITPNVLQFCGCRHG